MPATTTPRLLTATEAQIRSGRSMVRFRQWVAAGRLPFVIDELGRRRFDAEHVDRLVAEVDSYRLDDVTVVPEATAQAPTTVPGDEGSSDLQAQMLRFLQDAAEGAHHG